MSDTPRTDVQKQYLAFELDENGVMIPVVRKDFACELERENARLREALDYVLLVVENRPYYCDFPQARKALRDTEAK